MKSWPAAERPSFFVTGSLQCSLEILLTLPIRWRLVGPNLLLVITNGLICFIKSCPAGSSRFAAPCRFMPTDAGIADEGEREFPLASALGG